MSKDRILLVENDPRLQRLLRAQLLALEFSVQVADRGEDALPVAAEFEPDLILLAIALPGINGVETIRRLREWTQVPVIMLHGQDHEHLTVEALDAGADGYVIRPFPMAVLLARTRAVLRRARHGATTHATVMPLTSGNLTLDLVNRRVLLDDRAVHLTPTEYDLLRVLATHVGRVLTHRGLLIQVWGTASAHDTQYLHVFVSQLRRKLERDPHAPRHILTEPGIGYQFSAQP